MVRMKALGPLELELSDGTAAAALVAQPKRVAILAYLTASRPAGFHRRDHLMALFWPDSDARHARSALRQAIHFLNGSLGKGALAVRGREEVGVSREQIDCDVWAFERAVVGGRHREALRLYRGSLLAEFHLGEAPEFMLWLDQRREELRRAVVGAASSWGHEALHAGRWEEAVEAFRGGLEWGPYEEALVRGLLRALWGAGDRAAAIRAYDIFAKRLHADLELDPSTDTEAVLRELRASGLVRGGEGGRAEEGDLAADVAEGVEADTDPKPPPSGARVDVPTGSLRRRLLPAVAAVAVLLAFGIGRVGTTVPEVSTPPRIVVLPMGSLGPDPDDGYLAGGLHEEILTQLQKSGGLEVIGGTSVARYEGSDKTVAEIADELDADLVAESALRRDGNTVRVTVRVVDARTEAQIWAETYERPLADIFAVQTEIARRIAQALRVSLGAGEAGPFPPTENLEAYAAYLEGLYHQRRSSWRPEYAGQAVERFRQAVRLDPGFVSAWAHLVVAELAFGRTGARQADRDSARVALARLEGLSPSATETRWARGIFLYESGRFDEARADLEAMRAASPGDAGVLLYLAAVQRALGGWEESRQTLVDALRLDPVNPSLLADAGFTHRAAGRLTEARRYLELAVSLDPSVAYHWAELARASFWAGDTAGARAILDSATVDAGALVEPRARLELFARRPRAALEQLFSHPAEGDEKGWWDVQVIRAADAAGRPDLVREYGVTLRADAERSGTRDEPEEGGYDRQMWLATAHAYLGHHEEAVRRVETMLPIAHALVRSQVLVDVAKVYVVAGRHQEAIDLLDRLLATPGDDVSVPMLRLDPVWDPLRGEPRFEAMLERYADGGEP